MTTSEALEAKVVQEAQSTSGTSQEVGDQQITVDVTTGGTFVENEFANGFLVVNLSTGIGDMYKIVANKIRTGDDTLMDILLEKSVITAFAAGTEITTQAEQNGYANPGYI